MSIDKQHAQLTPEVGARDAVEEEVDAVVDVEDDARDEQGVLEAGEAVYELRGGDRLGEHEQAEPHTEERQVEHDEHERDDQQDDRELQPDDALLRDDVALAVHARPQAQLVDDHRVEHGDDHEGNQRDEHGEYVVQHERHELPVGVERAARHALGAQRVDAADDGLVHHQAQPDHHDAADRLLRRFTAADVLPPQRVTHTDVALHGEGHDEPRGEEPTDVGQVQRQLAHALHLEELGRRRARHGWHAPPQPLDQHVEQQRQQVRQRQRRQVRAGGQFAHVPGQEHPQ